MERGREGRAISQQPPSMSRRIGFLNCNYSSVQQAKKKIHTLLEKQKPNQQKQSIIWLVSPYRDVIRKMELAKMWWMHLELLQAMFFIRKLLLV